MSQFIRERKGQVLALVVVSMAALSMLLIGAWTRGGGTGGGTGGGIGGGVGTGGEFRLAGSGWLEPTAGELEVALLRAGLDPESLAAAGVTSNQVAGIVTSVRDFMTQNPGVMDIADRSFGDARRAHDASEKKIKSGKATQEEVAAHTQRWGDLASANTQRASLIDSVVATGTENLNASVTNTLSAIRANRAAWPHYPIEFLVVTDRNEADWVALRDALANERISAKLGETADSQAQTFLTTERARNEVVAASSNVSSNLDAITTAWDQGISR